VVATCGRCHEKSNAEFAASYTHILARGKLMVHDYVRIVYIFLIAIILGGMALHNVIIFFHELKVHQLKMKRKKSVMRMKLTERIQHILLLSTFIGLAITGFALRFPDAWWVKILTGIGLNEENRRLIHRILALVLVSVSFYHTWYLLFTKRGKEILHSLIPQISDIKDAFANIAYYLGIRKEKPIFDTFDYTQKAEYWALIWGTILMGITGFVLWFPAIATSWLPAWVVRVCETVHFYEAILAVSAIVIWHWFFVIFLPKEYPMNWVWLTGKMDYQEWKEHHSRGADKEKNLVILQGEE
jgi:cytochrome b subunit of formate dehydrogenase